MTWRSMGPAGKAPTRDRSGKPGVAEEAEPGGADRVNEVSAGLLPRSESDITD